MTFHIEPKGYVYGILSDLQGAFSCLRDAIIHLLESEISHRLLFHLNEAISWESVRDLSRMKNAFLLVENTIVQQGITDEIAELANDISAMLDEIFDDIRSGKKI
jgi:hypothetical protein